MSDAIDISDDDRPEPVECAITLYIDEDGDWTVCDVHDDPGGRRDDANLGGNYRMIRIVATARPPIAVQVDVTIPDHPADPVAVKVEG